MQLLESSVFNLHGEKRHGGRIIRPALVTTVGAGAGAGAVGEAGDEDEEDDEETGVEAAGGEGTLRGDRGADSAGEKHGFNRSMETVQGLSALHNTKVFSFRSRTL